MKNVIVICPDNIYLESILSIKDIFISVLVLSSSRQLEKLADSEDFKNKVGKVYYRAYKNYKEFFETNRNDYNLTAEDIQEYKKTHLKVFRHMHRVVHDYNEIDYRYLIALEYWIDVFNSNHIDMVLSSQSEHGFFADSIPLDIAKNRNIPVYINDVVLANTKKAVFSIRNHKNEKFLDIGDIFKKQKIDFNDYIYYVSDNECEKNKNYTREKKYKNKVFKKTLFKDYCHEIFKNFKLSAVQKFNKLTDVYQEAYRTDPINKYQNYRYVEEIKDLYDKLSCDMVSGEKFIFYSLHFEPEASIINRTKYSNQLFLIKMLSECLPDGWKIYVKDHPCQFAMDDKRLLYNFKFIKYFRTKQFYAQILRIPNTKLINIDVPSKVLINQSQASATIGGTVLMESIYDKKTCLMFGGDASPLGMLSDIFVINSKNDIKNALSKLQNGFIPTYSDLDDIACKYLYEFDYVNTEKFKNIIEFLLCR